MFGSKGFIFYFFPFFIRVRFVFHSEASSPDGAMLCSPLTHLRPTALCPEL